eukprot:COSAG02_NODE_114_length_35585_cov_149.458293_7_plen_230_part_00
MAACVLAIVLKSTHKTGVPLCTCDLSPRSSSAIRSLVGCRSIPMSRYWRAALSSCHHGQSESRATTQAGVGDKRTPRCRCAVARKYKQPSSTSSNWRFRRSARHERLKHVSGQTSRYSDTLTRQRPAALRTRPSPSRMRMPSSDVLLWTIHPIACAQIAHITARNRVLPLRRPCVRVHILRGHARPLELHARVPRFWWLGCLRHVRLLELRLLLRHRRRRRAGHKQITD